VFSQTIALIRYQLLGLVNLRLCLLLACFAGLGVLAGQFIGELALINSERIAQAAVADLMRYCVVILMLVLVNYQVAQDYELQFFDRLLAMPVDRYQYVLAQFCVIAVLSCLLVMPIALVLLLNNAGQSGYWTLAVYIELLLVGQIATLVAVSLEKLVVALIASLAFYLFAKTLPLIQLALNQSAAFYPEEAGFHFSQWFYSAVQTIMPPMHAFAQNNLMFVSDGSIAALGRQLIVVLVYSLFVQAIVLADFYRKELNRT